MYTNIFRGRSKFTKLIFKIQCSSDTRSPFVILVNHPPIVYEHSSKNHTKNLLVKNTQTVLVWFLKLSFPKNISDSLIVSFFVFECYHTKSPHTSYELRWDSNWSGALVYFQPSERALICQMADNRIPPFTGLSLAANASLI